MPPPAPFIVGTGRCGTTLLRLMLDAHPELAIPPETHFIPGTIGIHSARNGLDAFVTAVQNAPFWLDMDLDIDQLKAAVGPTGKFDLSGALRSFYRLYAEKRGKRRWGDKTPPYLMHMRSIQTILPEARFVHIIRDGRDVALSFRKLWFGPDTIEHAAQRWLHWIGEARRQAAELSGYLEVSFENLIQDPPTVLRRICAFIDLPFDELMLDYHRNAEARLREMVQPYPVPNSNRVISPTERRDIHRMTAQPPQPSRIDRWKTEMAEGDRRRFEAIAGEMLDELGYERG